MDFFHAYVTFVLYCFLDTFTEEPFHSSPLLTPLRPPPMLVPELAVGSGCKWRWLCKSLKIRMGSNPAFSAA